MSSNATMPASLAGAETVQTPCSTIYLLATLAYKVKKAVDLGWLDYTRLEERRRLCHEEVRLNAELAPGVYRRVVAVVRRSAGELALVTDDGAGAAVAEEYAVEMRRLPVAGMLDVMLAQGRVTEGHVETLVARLAAFHRGCGRAPFDSGGAYVAELETELRSNLEEFEPFAGELPDRLAAGGAVIERAAHASLRLFVDEFVRANAAELAARWASGRVVDGHGDLHAGNVCFDPASVVEGDPLGLVIYDRLEFRPEFRYKDVAAEMAHLATTCDHYSEGRSIGGDVLRRYAEMAGDAAVLRLSRGFRVHYALVRAKVHARRAAQADASEKERAEHGAVALRDANLALAYAAGPMLVLTCGLPGSGKSYVGRHLAAVLGGKIHRADEVRKELAGLGPTDRGGAEMYTAEMSARTYAEVLARCEGDLRAGRHAIADATFRTRANRAALVELARRMGVPIRIVHAYADEAETRKRLAARAASNTDASDADWAVYQSMAVSFEVPKADEGRVVMFTPETEPQVVVGRVLTPG